MGKGREVEKAIADIGVRFPGHRRGKIFANILEQHGFAVRPHGVFFGVPNLFEKRVRSVFADKRVNGFAEGQNDGLEAHSFGFREFQAFANVELLVSPVRVLAENQRDAFGSAGLELVEMAAAKRLVYRRDDSRNSSEIGGQRVEKSFDDNRIFDVLLDIERNVQRTGGVRNIRVLA